MSPLEEYVRHLNRRNFSPVTVKNYRWLVTRFLARAAKPFEELGREDVERFLATLPRPHLLCDFTTLRGFFAAVLPEGAPLPTDGIKVGRWTPKPPVLLSKDSVRAFLEKACMHRLLPLALRDRACLELLYGVALRGWATSTSRAARSRSAPRREDRAARFPCLRPPSRTSLGISPKGGPRSGTRAWTIGTRFSSHGAGNRST